MTTVVEDNGSQVQVLQRTDRIPGLVRRLNNAREEVADLKERLKSAKEEEKTLVEELILVNREIADLKNGQGMLPYESDDDDSTPAGTPAITATASALRDSSVANKGIQMLIAFDVLETQIASIQSGLGVSTIIELHEEMKRRVGWYKKCKGIGKAKAEAIAAAVERALTEGDTRPSKAESVDPEDAADSRMRRCSKCSVLRPQSEQKCVCGCLEFELDYAKAGDSESYFRSEDTEDIEVCDGCAIHICQHPDDGMFRSSYSYEVESDGDVIRAGSQIPHHGSAPDETLNDAIARALDGLAASLMAGGFTELADSVASQREKLIK